MAQTADQTGIASLGMLDRMMGPSKAETARNIITTIGDMTPMAPEVRRVMGKEPMDMGDTLMAGAGLIVGLPMKVAGALAKGTDALDEAFDILKSFKGVTVVKQHPTGIEIETPRYRKLTHLLAEMALEGANFIEISGNDDIMLSANSKLPYNGSLFSVSRQGYGDQRHLIEIKVKMLAEWIRKNDISQLQLEHIFDY